MGIVIHQEKITPEAAEALQKICPFGALDYRDGKLSVNAACKSCRLCVKNGPAGAVTWEEEKKAETVDKSQWNGIAVYAENRGGSLHPVTLELLGKAKELAAQIGHPVLAVLIGSGVEDLAEELLAYGADRVYLYDDPRYERYQITPYAQAFYDFIRRVRPSSILVGATNLGRSLAPKVAARCSTGLTADCTELKIKPNTDLVQIRPAFGGNIMAQIVTPNSRPQFCTVRYKIFSAPEKLSAPAGEIVRMTAEGSPERSRTEILEEKPKPTEIDISEADVIVACGRGVKDEDMFAQIRELASELHAQVACTRPLVEAGRMDPKRQIGLSGRTVKPKLILTVGVSGSVQFAAGMKNSDFIIAINQDPQASIFDIAHIGIVGDLNVIVPKLLEMIREGK